MNAKRVAVQDRIIKRMSQWDPSGINAKQYADIFATMSDADFSNFMQKMISGENPLSGTKPNFSSVKAGVQHNVKLASEMGYEMYKRIWVEDPITGKRFLTPLKHLVYEVNVCRQTQTLDHKISVAKDNTHVDERTGQPTGDSRSAQCSGPELMMLKSRGLTSSITEMMKFRGGDNVSMRHLDNSIIRTGTGSMNAVPGARERMPKSVQTMSAILAGMMFENNFAG